ncbi:hypothetical protein ACOI1H_14615 [Loktanella sp. DJP18]|uniref:hypothetical protein n=1 Tax=Loktanella sp. DJP18 TaxID=3409788 RepID=UPI003BB5011C
MTASKFQISFAYSDETQDFTDAQAAGRAFAAADAALAPLVIRSSAMGARTVARSMRTDAGFAKAAPTLASVLADPLNPEPEFWVGYHGATVPMAA